jgi:hypothetical protein
MGGHSTEYQIHSLQKSWASETAFELPVIFNFKGDYRFCCPFIVSKSIAAFVNS